MLVRLMRWSAALMVAIIAGASAYAHPMGNFSVNHYSRIDVQTDRVLIHYFIDLAEIPTYQELQEGNIAAGPDVALHPEDAAVVKYVATRGRQLGEGLNITVTGRGSGRASGQAGEMGLSGRRLPLRVISSGVIFPAGAGGLPTMKMGFVFEAAYPTDLDRHDVTVGFVDTNYEGHSGWKEIVATSVGSLLKTSVPETDRSKELSDYPTDLLNSPPQTLEASLEVALPALAASEASTKPVEPMRAPGAGQASRGFKDHERDGVKAVRAAKTPEPTKTATASTSGGSRGVEMQAGMRANMQRTPRSKFTELITEQHLSLWFLITAALIAMGLGALHALEPGHGKTIVAAYLVGSRGTARHAVWLGMIVTVSHTAGVFALGAITLYASKYIVPEQLYPWLGVFSGATIAVLGCYMFLRRWTGTATDHSHAPGSGHAHLFFWRRAAEEGTAPGGQNEAGGELLAEGARKQVSMTQLFTLGITGGIIPCPAALIVLLSAFALHRIALGFFLIVAFSLGLAAVLIGFGMFMVYARRFMTRLQIDGPLTTRWLPLASSAFITLLGMGVAIQAFWTAHLHIPELSKERIGPLLFVTGLGLILGMRHSTDADHVVAISTIVTKQRSIRNAAFIGSVWGLGHTITIFVVGSLIILFGVEIPPRVGLSMEFCVALMLIVLGLLNLTGMMQRITAYFTPGAKSGGAEKAGSKSAVGLEPLVGTRGRGPVAAFGLYQCVRPLVIGLVHGLAGSAAVALLVLSTIHNPYWATVYLVIFGIGTMIGMMCMTAAIAVPLTYAGDRFGKLSHYFGMASGVVSLCFGSFLVYQLGFLGGLFTSHPQWTPQ